MFSSPFSSSKSTQPVSSYNFMVYLDMFKIPFYKISSIESGIETEPLIEGGKNFYPHSLRVPIQSEKTLKMERGVITSATSMASFDLGTTYKFIIIGVRDGSRSIKKIYAAETATLKSKSLSPLDASTGQVFVETLEFIYQDLIVVPDLLIQGLNLFT